MIETVWFFRLRIIVVLILSSICVIINKGMQKMKGERICDQGIVSVYG